MKRIFIILAIVFSIVQATHGQWTTASLCQARSNLTATSVGTKVFFAGGYVGSEPSFIFAFIILLLTLKEY